MFSPITGSSSVRILIIIAFLSLVLLEVFSQRSPKKVYVGIFLDTPDEVEEFAVVSAINRINFFKKSGIYEVNPIILRDPDGDVRKTGYKACQLLQIGVAAIFGPDLPSSYSLINSMASTLEIPHFVTSSSLLLSSSEGPSQVSTFNLHPTPRILAKALATVLTKIEWRSYVILYENNENLGVLQEAFRNRWGSNGPVLIRKLGEGPDYRPILKEVRGSGETQIILDCHADRLIDVLIQAREVRMLEEYHSYILTSLDAHTLNWTKLHTVPSNIMSMRLLDPAKGGSLDNVVKDWELVSLHRQLDTVIPETSVKTKTALLYDAINLFMTVYSDLDLTEELKVRELNCESDETSLHGFRMAAFISVFNLTHGVLPGPLSGPIVFNSKGQREDFKLQIIELYNTTNSPKRTTDDFFRVIGTWDSKQPHLLNFAFTSEQREQELNKSLQEKNFRVVSRLGAPYLMKRDTGGKALEGNARFEGYAMDLIHNICLILKCNYTFELVPDNQYGSYNYKTNEWNGLIGHLLDRKADLAVCDLTITYERKKAVDFTVPFMTLGISILFAKAVKEPPELLSFTDPLSLDVWLYMVTAFVGVSLISFLVSRLHPAEWENPHPCQPCPQELENIWSLRNCFWLTLGSIMAQGCDLLPKGISTRLVVASWWFFSLIMTSCYTANLAAFLTNERMGPSIESAEDLAAQTQIKYGCLDAGATMSFFRDSNFSTYHRMWVQMESADPGVFEASNADGVKRVLGSKRKYAFLMESSTIEYEIERNCDLVQVGNWLDSKGYGIAMPNNAPYRKQFNAAILKMQEMGVLHNLKKKWWKELHGGGKCETDKHSEEETATELSLLHVGGVFVVLGVGVILALLIAVGEFLWNIRKVAVTQQISLAEAFKREGKFALNIWIRKKIISKPATQEIDLVRLDIKTDLFSRNLPHEFSEYDY